MKTFTHCLLAVAFVFAGFWATVEAGQVQPGVVSDVPVSSVEMKGGMDVNGEWNDVQVAMDGYVADNFVASAMAMDVRVFEAVNMNQMNPVAMNVRAFEQVNMKVVQDMAVSVVPS
jgi:hypothetical protein